MIHLQKNSKLMAKLGALLPKCAKTTTGSRYDLTKVCYDVANGCYVSSNGGLLLTVHCLPLDFEEEELATLELTTYECIGTRVLTNSKVNYVDWKKVVPNYDDCNGKYRCKGYHQRPDDECSIQPYLDLYRDFSIKVADSNRKVTDELMKLLGLDALTVYASGPTEPLVFRWDFDSGEYIEVVTVPYTDILRDKVEDGIHRLSAKANELEQKGYHVDLSHGNVVSSSGNVSEKCWNALVTVEVTTEGFPCDYIVANVSGNVDEVETQLNGLLTLAAEGVSKSA